MEGIGCEPQAGAGLGDTDLFLLARRGIAAVVLPAILACDLQDSNDFIDIDLRTELPLFYRCISWYIPHHYYT